MPASHEYGDAGRKLSLYLHLFNDADADRLAKADVFQRGGEARHGFVGERAVALPDYDVINADAVLLHQISAGKGRTELSDDVATRLTPRLWKFHALRINAMRRSRVLLSSRSFCRSVYAGEPIERPSPRHTRSRNDLASSR